MDKANLLNICLIISIIGIISLLLLLEVSQPEYYQIKDITKKQVDTQIKIEGKIISTKDLPGILILDVKDNSSKITVIAFKDFPIKELKNGISIETIGKVTEYQRQLEIIADEIKIKNDS